MIFKGVEICCPYCRGDLRQKGTADDLIWCESCDRCFPIILDIADLRVFPDPYIGPEADRAKGLRVGGRFAELNFAELVDFYYSITPAVPPHHARQYTRGLLAGFARAQGTLEGWETATGRNGAVSPRSMLEIGCGTGPMLVAAAPHFTRVVGVDISFRWLVVAKKRLIEAGLDVPLICACAEALPFPDESFDWVVADSVLEHVQDQSKALAESLRVMRAAGYLCLSTPNRYSLGPDPQAGIWAGGYLPEGWLAAYVRWQGGVPPKRRLLSARSLSGMIREAGFSRLKILLPDIATGQQAYMGKGMNLLIDLYHTAKRLPVSRHVLRWVGPLLHAVAQKPGIPPVARQESRSDIGQIVRDG